ncbi:MAG: AAA domain-containing protein, partial [Thermomicrobiales bacterium]
MNEGSARSTDRAIRLFQYLKELSELRTRVVRSVDAYESVLWLADIPHELECYSASWFQEDPGEEDERWISVGKPRPLLPPPPFPAALQPWVAPVGAAGHSSEREPVLLPEIEHPTLMTTPEDPAEIPEPVIISLREHPEISAQWEGFLERVWRPWAAEDQRRRQVQTVYAELFSIYQRQQRLGEQFEVVLGLGLLGWRTPAGNTVKRHLLTAQTGIRFDPVSGVITVGPAGEGARLELEQDMLEATERPDLREQEIITEQREALNDALWQEAPLRALFAAWVHAVSAHGRYEAIDDPAIAIGANPQVRLAPALILRKRTERSLIRMFSDIIERLEGGEPLPPGVRRLVEVVDDAAFGERFGGDDGAPPGSSEVYFPLPANDEQREIVSRLGSRQGVLVQGPPGTGKSHTIANLVCHLLATGQRVLVTSHTPRALKVLRDKIPAEIRPLCVSLLGDDQVALKNLEDSVHSITDRYYRWNARQGQAEIARLTGDLDQARRSEAEILRKILGVRESETLAQPLPIAGYVGTAEGIARQLVEEEAQHAWLELRPAVDARAPLQNAEALQLLALLRQLPADREAEVRLPRVSLAKLPPVEQFRAMADHEAQAQRHAEADRQIPAAEISQFTAMADPERGALREQVVALVRAVSSLQSYPEPWVGAALAQVFAGRDLILRQLLAETSARLTRIAATLAAIGDPDVRGLEGRDERVALSDATDLAAHLQGGGKWGVGPFRPEPVKRAAYLSEGVTVDGRKCNQVETLQRLVRWLAMQDDLRALYRQWAAYAPAPAGPATLQVAAYRDLQRVLEDLLAAAEQLGRVRTALASAPGLTDAPPLHDLASVRGVLARVDAAGRAAEVQRARAAFAETEKALADALGRAGAHEAVAWIATAVDQRVGAAYEAAYGVLAALEQDRIALAERDQFVCKLDAAAPHLLARLQETPDDAVWDARLAAFQGAWDWARADAYVAGRSDLRAYQELVRALTHTRDVINATMGRLAAERAWRFCFERMTETERQNLMAWMQSMRKIGKGTGKYAARHRQAARQYMDQCRSAIPAWIMPIYRVAESVRPGADVFDVVIVDEASQSGPEALFLQYIARQIVVVGDDQQISPESVGINREDVLALQARHIADLEFRENLGVDNSFFDQAVIRFGGRIRLREHFRCMPEIIQFSNNLSYQTEPLYPLRQYGLDRLDPIRLVRVPDGYRVGESSRATNPPEAQAIVDQIIACHNDPRYAGKTMGVISLQGGTQAKTIERMLLDQLGAEAYEERQIVCGDAYAFQGDERDIIFMSLVAARGQTHNPRALTGEADTRRFNVAASRARDQVWLFHTIALEDLKPDCLRFKLLSYYTNPTVAADDAPETAFESPFEEAVYERIVARGYHVRPQVKVAEHRIDLVVEGMRGRLAVECDGERWHGAEQYQHDMARQRHLERCGWTFWRVRGGAFYRDPDAALEDLWQTLDRLGISPQGVTPEAEPAPPPLPENDARREPSEDVTSIEDLPPLAEITRFEDVAFPEDEAFPENVAPREDVAFPEDAAPREDVAAWLVGDVSPPVPAELGWLDALDGALGAIRTPELHPQPQPESQLLLSPEEPHDLPLAPVPPSGERANGRHPTPVNGSASQDGFAPFEAWVPRALPDPLVAERAQVLEGLLEIIASEGPMPGFRAYLLYAEASGLGGIDSQVRPRFNQAAYAGESQWKLATQNETGVAGQMHLIMRVAGTPAVRLREPGDRLLTEIPPSEIAAALRWLADDIGLDAREDAAELFARYLHLFHLDAAVDP